jgi:hypothetical protein
MKICENKELIESIQKEKDSIQIIESKEIELKTEKDIIKEIERLKSRFREKTERYKDIVSKLKSIVSNKSNESNLSISNNI